MTDSPRIDSAIEKIVEAHYYKLMPGRCACGYEDSNSDFEGHLAHMVADTIEPMIRRDERNRIAFDIVGKEYE